MDTNYYIPVNQQQVTVLAGLSGIRILMNKRVTVTWWATGEEWTAVGSRSAVVKWHQVKELLHYNSATR